MMVLISLLIFIGSFQSIQSLDFLKNLKESECQSHMNNFYGPTKNWTCTLFGNEKKDNHVSCLCVYTYKCFDFEDFMLEKDFIEVSEYMSKEFYLGTNFYTQECENGLNELTNVTNWSCLLKYDIFHLDDYYCECKRVKECQIEKYLTLKI